MRRSLLSLFLLAALPAFAEMIDYEPCVDEPPESVYGRPLCAERSLNKIVVST